MGWAWAYLAVSVVGALFVVNAYTPLRSGPVSVLSFFGGWITGELPLHNIFWQAVATAVFGVFGAFGSWPGWLGLAITFVAWAGLLGLHREGRRAFESVDAALDGLFAGAASDVPSTEEIEADIPWTDTMWKAWRLVWPIAQTARTFEAIRNVDYWGDGIKAHRLDIIRRRGDRPSNAPVFVYVHGGAWIIGDKREQGFPLMLELARRGFVCVTINYRLSPKGTWPDHIVDCKKALAWVHSHIGEYGGDPRFVAVSGGSAGGHLAALLALTQGDPAFQPGFEDADTAVSVCVPVYGVYDMTCTGSPGDRRYVTSYNKGLLHLLERRVFKTTLAADRKVFEDASPLARVNAGAPPFFVIHGANDTLVPVSEARRFVKALGSASGSVVAYAELPRTQHAFDVMASARPAHVIAGIVRFVEGVRKGSVTGAGRQAIPEKS